MKHQSSFPTKQVRSQLTLERILDAAELLLIDADFNEISLKQIALAAGVSTGAIYARMDSKDALLETLLRRYIRQAEIAFTDFLVAAEGKPVETVCELMIATLITLFSDHRGVVRTALLTQDNESETVTEVARIYALARLRLEECANELGNERPKETSGFALTLIISTCREKIVLNQSARFFDINSDAFTRELTSAVFSYLKH